MLQQRLSTVNRQQSLETDCYHGDSMAPRKNRQNDRQAICFLYASSVVAASLSLAVASMEYADPNDHRSITAEWGRPLFVSSLYATSCLILLAMAGYFESHRSETFEAVHRGTGPVPFSVKFSIKGEKVNLYLRLGLAMFGVMSIGHVAVKFVEDRPTTNNVFCLHLKSILEMAFFVLQTLFILRYHRLVILRYNEAMGAGLVHLLTTNLCVWADISVGKIDKTLSYGKQWRTKSSIAAEHYHHPVDHPLNSNTTDEIHPIILSLNLIDISFYLLPTVSEYCLLAAALLYEITVRIGQPSFIEIEKSKEGNQSNGHRKECKDCSASAGSWFGIVTVLLVLALTIVTATTPKYVENTSNFWKSIIILAEEAILCLFGIAFVIMAFVQIRKLKFSIATRQSHLEEFLLYTAFFFSANYTISTMILSADFEDENRTFNTMHNTERYLLICRCTLNAFELVQILFQTYMIQDSFHRCSDRVKHQIMKPGRQAIVALLGINLAFWIQQSFQLKNADILFLIESDKGAYGWILYVVTMPISLFYRYHCTVCLSQCFNKLYEDETHRFEEIWRYRVDPLTDMVNPTMGSICIYGQEDGFPLDTKERKPSEVSLTNNRVKRMAAFAKTKPWKTIDFPEERQIITPVLEETTCDTCSSHMQTVHLLGEDTVGISTVKTDSDKLDVMSEKDNASNGMEQNDVNNVGVGQFIGSAGATVPSKFTCQTLKSRPSSTVDSPTGQAVELNTSPNENQPVTATKSQFRNSALFNDSNIPPHRRQTVSLKLIRTPCKDDELFLTECEPKPNETSKLPRHSLTKHFAQPPPIRRRRTLRNLETAKYRVLAAELAHRMVIERGGTNANGHTNPLGDKSPEPQSDHSPSDKLNETVAYNTVHSFSPIQTAVRRRASTRHSSGRKSEFRVAQAMTETAAITIAPVETQVAISLQSGLNIPQQTDDSGVVENDSKSPKKFRHRPSLFPGRASYFTASKTDREHSAHSAEHSPEVHHKSARRFREGSSHSFLGVNKVEPTESNAVSTLKDTTATNIELTKSTI
ncbi:Otopetrin [Fasciola gigantica]|uniref:Otopetrin n=1 Tax=Fasciola gigantica TaxID=46835 RepID=A0A504YVQ8_FASGI|nr:Otopetrin [Fasciola gigantica]